MLLLLLLLQLLLLVLLQAGISQVQEIHRNESSSNKIYK